MSNLTIILIDKIENKDIPNSFIIFNSCSN